MTRRGSIRSTESDSNEVDRKDGRPRMQPYIPMSRGAAPFRRNSIATMDTRRVPFKPSYLAVTPEYCTTERSAAYNDLAELIGLEKKMCRRNSMTKVESEMKLRHSLATTMEYKDRNESLKDIKERFSTSRASVMTSRSSNGRASPSVIGSVVETATRSDADVISLDLTSYTPAVDSASIPLSLVHQTIQRKRKYNLERENLIESLVNFSCHTPRAVLEDLIANELKLWERPGHLNILDDERKREIKSSPYFSDGDVSSLSDENEKTLDDVDMVQSVDPMESMSLLALTPSNSLPRSKERESALLFVDINGFTKLSTLLDVESLSKVINSYFEMIVSEVILHRGDILKFAGDAFFAEWRSNDGEDSTDDVDDDNALKKLNASIASSQELSWPSISSGSPTVSACVWQAAMCATSIVRKFSDYHVATTRESSFDSETSVRSESMLNVHCGIGAGRLVGLHVGDYHEGDDDDEEGLEDDAVELRREYLFLGDAINQVSQAAHIASDGEVMASPEAIRALSMCCDIPFDILDTADPVRVACRDQTFLSLEPKQQSLLEFLPDEDDVQIPIYEHLRRHCINLHRTALSRLHLQMALYVHPVVRGDELSISQRAKALPKIDAPQSRHLAEAELRSVYTMFIKAMISPRLASRNEKQQTLLKTLGKIMHVTSRELDRYSGQLRQFIVDDKGVVLIATFGLRGSTFPNLVANNALPATFDIHRALKEEVGVQNKIGATFGMVYCGVVGGVRRHEFSVMGAPVNLAARLMESRMNKGMLVDEAVRAQADDRFAFKDLPPVTAKGYDKPVSILEPLHAIESSRKKGTTIAFAGRHEERSEILGIAKEILSDPVSAKSSVINLIGESGIGKSALGISIMNEVKMECLKQNKKVVCTRSTSTETEQRIPLCAFREVFLSAIREMCVHDGSLPFGDDKGERESQFFLKRDIWENTEFLSEEQKEVGAVPRTRSIGYDKPRRRSYHDPRLPSGVKVPSRLLHEQRRSFRHAGIGRPAIRASGRRASHVLESPPGRPSIHKMRSKSFVQALERNDSFGSLHSNRPAAIPYLEKLVWACEKANYPHEYADLVGSQFLGLETANPTTHVNGDLPQVTQLVEFVAQAYMRITDFADLVLVFIDDFQWVDSFTWKVIRSLGQNGKNMLLICAMRSHDKQAMRRMSTHCLSTVNFRLEITLGPLYLGDIRDLLRTVLKYGENTSDDQLCSEIYQRTGGLPVYVIELLEDIKRNRTTLLNEDGVLRLSPESLIEQMRMENSALVMKESLLNRFDALDVRVRKVLQTCAVLGNSFALSDLIRVHPEIEEIEIEQSLNAATDEMILLEIMEEDEDSRSMYSNSTGGSETRTRAYSRTSTGFNVIGDRYFQFSHDMWRNNVLTTMLKERKIELHRLIAEAMEMDQVLILERSDIARLLTLFDHWKSCGDFLKSAPLALAVGIRLNEWELSSQSVDLYRDALDMCFESVEPIGERSLRYEGEWVQVAAQPEVLDLIVRLHIRIAESQRLMGDLGLCARTFEDAYRILNSSSATNRSLMVPIMSGLCSVKLEFDAYDDETATDQELLVQQFVKAAQDEGNSVHLARALALEAVFFARRGNFERALQDQELLQVIYKIELHSTRIVEQYKKDYAAECFSHSVQWYYMLGQEDNASKQADLVIQKHLTFQKPSDIDSKMGLILPVLLVLKFIGRAAEAEYIVKKYIINAYHEFAPYANHWVETFNPICYLLETAKMEEEEKFDTEFLEELEYWVLDDSNTYYSHTHLRLCHTLMGEICWRLANLKAPEDCKQQELFNRSRAFLIPVAHDFQSESFLKHSALAILDSIEN